MPPTNEVRQCDGCNSFSRVYLMATCKLLNRSDYAKVGCYCETRVQVWFKNPRAKEKLLRKQFHNFYWFDEHTWYNIELQSASWCSCHLRRFSFARRFLNQVCTLASLTRFTCAHVWVVRLPEVAFQFDNFSAFIRDSVLHSFHITYNKARARPNSPFSHPQTLEQIASILLLQVKANIGQLA